MSKPVPVHPDSPRPRSPASALLAVSKCLATSRVALPVHDVSTTPATTPEPPSARPAGRSADPALHDLPRLGWKMSVPDGAQLARVVANTPQPPCRIGAAECYARGAGSGAQIA